MRGQLRRRAYGHKGAACQPSTGAQAAPNWRGMNPDDYSSMAEVRAGVDAIDRDLVALLAQRFAHMRAAARIKPDRGAVRDEARKRQLIDQACAQAAQLGVPVAIVADL